MGGHADRHLLHGGAVCPAVRRAVNEVLQVRNVGSRRVKLSQMVYTFRFALGVRFC